MNVNEEQSYCKFCKRLLDDPKEIELNYHLLCNESFKDEFKEYREVLNQLVKVFDLPEREIIEKITKKLITYTLNEQGKINELNYLRLANYGNFPVTGQCEYKYNDNFDIIEASFYEYGYKTLPDPITSYKNLEKLSINYFSHRFEFDEEIEDYYNNRIKSFPVDLCNLQNLQYIDLSWMGIHQLPNNFGNLKNLKTLILKINGFSSLPDFFRNLQNLSSLDLSQNKFTVFPPIVLKLTNLSTLNLSHNNLTSLPESVNDMKNLTELNLLNNKLSSVPKNIGNMTNLITLTLRTNKINSIPETIGNMNNLENLDLSFNKNLKLLPSSIGNLSKLQVLNVGRTGIENLPCEMSRLTNLKSLWIANDQAESFVEFGKDLANFKELIIYSGRSSRLHEVRIFNFPNSVNNCLKELKSKGCHILRC